jgi:hypothetical protein
MVIASGIICASMLMLFVVLAGARRGRPAPDLGWQQWTPSLGRLWVVPLMLLATLLIAVIGLDNPGADDAALLDQESRDALLRMHRDLDESITMLRSSGYEVTADDVGSWLRSLNTGAYLSGGSTAMTLLDSDTARHHFLVAARNPWRNATTEETRVGQACGRLRLTNGLQAPLKLTIVTCPPDAVRLVEHVATWCPAGCAEDQNLLSRTVLRVQRSRWETPPGAPVALTPLPGPTRPVGDLRAASDTLRCAPGTRDVGVHAAYVDGRQLQARLCAVPGLPSSGVESVAESGYYVVGARGQAIVNARVSGAVLALVRAVRRQGLSLTANSSFRTMGHQRDLCRRDAGCLTGDYTLVAPPGRSQHQLGVALDIGGTRVAGARSCGPGRAMDPSSTVWRFLRREAGEFGLRQYAAESWHWDALPGSDRCVR